MNRLKIDEFPALTIQSNGLVFYSNKKHRLKISDAKVMQVGNSVYIRKGSKTLQLMNVDKVFIEKEYLYFKAMGKTKIIFDCNDLVKYFTIKIVTSKIDIEKFKKLALIDIKNHIFDYKNAKFLKIYLKIIRNILKISLEDNKLTIKQNKFKIPFQIEYAVNGVKKRIKINC